MVLQLEQVENLFFLYQSNFANLVFLIRLIFKKDFYPWMALGGKSYLLNHELGHSLGLADLYAQVTTQGNYPFTGGYFFP
jgi:hypothetical protein